MTEAIYVSIFKYRSCEEILHVSLVKYFNKIMHFYMYVGV